jgi:type III secretory pathway component EscV
MKKFIAIAVILMCCLVYAIVKLSMSENQNMSQNQKAYKQAEETQSAKQINADNTDNATPEEDSGSAVPATAAQVEAVTKALSEFISAIKSEDYEQAWMLTSKVVKPEMSFEEFKKGVADARNELVNVKIHPESSINIEGRVGLLVTNGEQYYFFFIQEDGQWKFSGPEPAQNVDTSKE